MATIDKLSILGIRAFDHKNSMAIQFQAPLTLIVGMNGCGKTTIIECLKYVTTGELPPNTGRGASFVHDPQMAGEKEVLGQVKVSFTATEGNRMICTRNLQLTVKQKTRSVKALEGNIRMLKEGEKSSISSRVGEMNTLMPRYLGVSKAVLDFVIFCHQEESLWPMQAPKDLKEKFDQIFEAQKYTKAIDNIKILQKNKKIELVTLKNDEEHYKVNHEKSKKLRAHMLKLLEQSQQLEQEQADYQRQLKEAKKEAARCFEKIGEADLIVGELTGKRIARATKDENVQTIRDTLSEMSDSDEELQNMLTEHQDRIQEIDNELAGKKNDYQKLDVAVKDTRGQISLKERELGNLEAKKESFDQQVENRKQLVRETARSHDIRGFDLEIDDDRVHEFMERITRLARDKQAEFERVRSALQDELQTQQKVLNRINEGKSAQKQMKETSRETIVSYDRKISALQTRLSKIEYDEGSKVALETQVQETEHQLRQAKSDLENSTWSSDIEAADTELRKLEAQREKLEAEFMEASRRAGDSAQLDFVKKELKERQRSLEAVTSSNGDKITARVGNNWTSSNLEATFQRVALERASQLTDAESQRNGTLRELDYVNAKLSDTKKERQQAQSDMKAAENKIRKVMECAPEDYHVEMATLEESNSRVESDKALYDFFKWSIGQAKKHNACMLCTREFKEHNSLNAMIARAEEYQKTKAVNATQDLDQIQRELKAGKEAATDFDTWERLKEKILPANEKVLTKLNDERNRLVALSEEQDAAVDEKKSLKTDIDSLSRYVQSIAKYSADITNYEQQIKELTARQKQTGSSRGIEAVQDDKKKLDGELKVLHERKTDATDKRDKTKSRISTYELRLSDLKGKLSTAAYQLKDMEELQAQEAEYKKWKADERKKITDADGKLQSLESELSSEQFKYDDITRRGKDKDGALQDERAKLNNSVNNLKMAEQEIQSYHDKGWAGKLIQSRREVDNAKSELTAKESEQSNIVRAIKKLEEHKQTHDGTKRSIIDNQRFRRDLRTLQDLDREIAELESRDAEADKARFEKECNSWKLRWNELSNKEASVSGQLRTLNDSLENAQADWDTDYKNAANAFKEAHIRVETTKAAIDDLGRYGGALDKAIMKYHSLKMEEINRIIGQLWRDTYQGTDVDTIMIRSESETVRANKSYNYRVCMLKQDTEMDMRGRCSAGQKVLASIIIRLALAECFGSNCGVVALDEPTTNLDKENIEALAKSLAAIIKIRRSQRNFQILVITHDEDFLRCMQCSDFADHYYRVYRNNEQHSTIAKQSIAEIM